MKPTRTVIFYLRFYILVTGNSTSYIMMREIFGILLMALSGFLILVTTAIAIQTLLKISKYGDDPAYRSGYVFGSLIIPAIVLILSIFLIKKSIRLINSPKV